MKRGLGASITGARSPATRHGRGTPRRRERPPARRRPARGMSSLLMLMILVTLGSLSVHAVGLVTAALGDGSRAVALARATEAAAAGLDWGRERALRAGGGVCTPAQNINTLPGSLQPFTVTVRCAVGAPVADGAAALRRFQITATACNQPLGGSCPTAGTPGPSYVQRTASFVLHTP